MSLDTHNASLRFISINDNYFALAAVTQLTYRELIDYTDTQLYRWSSRLPQI